MGGSTRRRFAAMSSTYTSLAGDFTATMLGRCGMYRTRCTSASIVAAATTVTHAAVPPQPCETSAPSRSKRPASSRLSSSGSRASTTKRRSTSLPDECVARSSECVVQSSAAPPALGRAPGSHCTVSEGHSSACTSTLSYRYAVVFFHSAYSRFQRVSSRSSRRRVSSSSEHATDLSPTLIAVVIAAAFKTTSCGAPGSR